LTGTDKAFTSYDIHACLYDTRRVELFQQAIQEIVQPGDIVVDAGSGSGVLGLLAAAAGAGRVYCIELNGEFVPVIEEHARRNGFADRVVAIHADATTVALPEPVDIIISEVISAGFFYEPQLQILDNLRRFLKPGGSIVPLAMDNWIELIDAQDKLYGLTFNYDSRFAMLAGDRSLTTKASYLLTDFHERTGSYISSGVTVRSVRSGVANALRITYRIRFTETLESAEPTDFLLNPQIIFLSEPVVLDQDEEYHVSIGYEASSSPLSATIKVDPVPGKAR